jgi:trans-aconitate methyltransferase
MIDQNFTEISKRYRETSIIQNSAADILFALLDIKDKESVLDVGCGTGNLTKKIFDKSHGYIVGVDPSEGMINESSKHYGNEIHFQLGSAEDLPFENKFDVIFCNSTFQWVTDAKKAVRNFHSALKPHGRIGIQAPARRDYCPNFVRAVDAIIKDETLGRIFQHFRSPWLFFDTSSEYTDLFQPRGFNVPFCEIQTIETLHSPEEVYNIFASGAIAGYLNQSFYNCEITGDYIRDFQDVIKSEFIKQAHHDGMVKLVFNRIFLIGVKE